MSINTKRFSYKKMSEYLKAMSAASKAFRAEHQNIKESIVLKTSWKNYTLWSNAKDLAEVVTFEEIK